MTYWVYVHENESGDIVEDGGDISDLGDAIDEVCSMLRVQGADYHLTHTARVVDNDTSSMVWIAGKMTHIELGFYLGVIDDLTYDRAQARRDPTLRLGSRLGMEDRPDPMITVYGLDID